MAHMDSSAHPFSNPTMRANSLAGQTLTWVSESLACETSVQTVCSELACTV